ncbi:MAG: hypothetical protein ACXACX_22495 [Candidatus Hodarchaeales archaeon]|jgi:hypothetical protein
MVASNINEDPDSRIRKWLVQFTSFRQPIPATESKKLEETNEDHVKVAAYYLSLEKKPYNTLCWILAEKILKKTDPTPVEDEIRNKAEEIADLEKTYDELCYLNAELDILMKL